MKRFFCILLVSVVVLSVGCRPKNQPQDPAQSLCLSQSGSFAYTQKEGQRYMLTRWKGCSDLDDVQYNRYSLPWPEKGMLTPEAERELLYDYFGDTTATTFEEAANRWVTTNWYADGLDALYENVFVDTVPGEWNGQFNFSYLDGKVEESGNLVLFRFELSDYMGGAHGMYALCCRIYDRDAAKMVHLEDLVDMTGFGEVIASAINDLDVNKKVRDNVYLEGEPSQTSFSVPEVFYIDSTRSSITLVYQVYDIACYASGLQEVVMPVAWLSKHCELTPYAKKLFGEGCSR